MAVTGFDEGIAELAKRTDHRSLAIWAADCAERALPYFEKRCPEDDRPRKAIDAARAWVRGGEFRMSDLRKASLNAHAAAREVAEDDAARSAARAAGQAVATAHVPSHAIAAAIYAATAVRDANPFDAEAATEIERKWQHQHLIALNEMARRRNDPVLPPSPVLEPRSIAPCGMNCALCMAFQRTKKRCLGCWGDDVDKPMSCRSCIIRNCENIRDSSSHFCHLLPTQVQADRETWMNIYQQEQKIGYVHRQIFKTLEGYKILESVFMQINTMGMMQDLRFRTVGSLKPDLTLSSFDFELFSSLFRFKARGALKDKTLTLSMASGAGPEQKLNLPLKKDIHLSVGLLEILSARDLKPGDSRTFTVFDPITTTERSVKILVVEEETILVMDREEKAKKVSVEFMGVSQYAWIGKDGAALREEGPLGISLEQVAKEEALQKIAVLPGTDIAAFASIPSSRMIRSVDQLTELKLRLTGIDERALFLEGDRQSFQDRVLIIRREPVSDLPSTSG